VLSLQTESGDQAIDRLADGVTLVTQVPVVWSGSNSQFAPATLENVEPQQIGPHPRELAVIANSPQNLAEDQVG
jgi:hypothetical protein